MVGQGSRVGEAQCGVSKSAPTAPVAVAGNPRATASKIPSLALRIKPPGNPARRILSGCKVGDEISARVRYVESRHITLVPGFPTTRPLREGKLRLTL